MERSSKHFAEGTDHSLARSGLVCGLAAYLIWGLVPIYFKAVAHVPAAEVLAHRVVWSVALLWLLVAAQRRGRAAVNALRSRRTALALLVSTLLIAGNWFVFIWTVANDQVLQASLGYYISPLVTMLLGFVFLGERIRRLQTVSVVLAAAGVAYLTYDYGEVPLVALALACSFSIYALLRKTARIDALEGLTVETTLLVPLALAYVVYVKTQGTGAFTAVSWQTDALLLAAGVVTVIPLLLFTVSARRLRLTTLGFVQYIAPTSQFLLAIALYGEDFTRTHLISFGCIWTALVLYVADAARMRNRVERRNAAKDSEGMEN